MTYNKTTRERCFRDILVDMKARLDSENDFGLEIEFEKNNNWKGDGFNYIFTMTRPYEKLSEDCYDKYIELKNFANEMFGFLLNQEMITMTFSENRYGCEFEFVSEVNAD